MTPPLLPASAAPFAPRTSSVSVVLGSKVEPWLTQTLKRISRVKQRRLNSAPQHQRYLTETLSSPNAIWTLASIMLPKSPEPDFKRDANNPLVEAMMNYEILHIEGYVVHIDMVLRNEVAYKLTKDTINTLIEHHKEVYCVGAANTTYSWPDGEHWCKKLHEDFVQAINEFVFFAHVSTLEGLEEGGTGELLKGGSNEVKEKITSLMKSPRPRALDAIQRNSLFLIGSLWSQPGMSSSQPAIELWRGSPSVSSVSSPTGIDNCLDCVSMAQSNPVPTAAFTQSHLTADFSYNSPQETALISTLPLPSMPAATQYGISMAMSGMCGSYSNGWDRCQEYAATHVFAVPQDDSLSSVVVSSSECAFFPSFMPKAFV
ncbi:hypothetical protein BHE90_016703 [Fusarium euwallaceae]|uniref:Uncharacterized protein n=2 Tax=Fusarium solani species complex TaxID=232080 RepID=A0A430KZM7_9HYPO|nr:hypothetical protein CDV31_017156 [Fusarium ambrosium]RTE68918.1 hypothetical protein BHE90_016703 [Fusarium euwallaceae]